MIPSGENSLYNFILNISTLLLRFFEKFEIVYFLSKIIFFLIKSVISFSIVFILFVLVSIFSKLFSILLSFDLLFEKHLNIYKFLFL